MIYDIEEGAFDLDGIKAVCKGYGVTIDHHIINSANDGTDERFIAFVTYEDLGKVPLINYLTDIEIALSNNNEADTLYSLTAHVTRDHFEIKVFN